MALTEQQLADAISFGREQASVEFKSPGPRTHRRLQAQVIRAMLGMSNRRDGGHVVVGVSDRGGVLQPDGLSDADLATWAYDSLADNVARYAEPNLQFNLQVVALDARAFLVIDVMEFAEVPSLCRKDYNDGDQMVLREGACYIRPRRKPETVEVGTYADMRDLIDLASEKIARRLITAASHVGLAVTEGRDDRAAFDAQVSDFL